MHILYCFDEAYSMVAAVSMLSLVKKNKNIIIHVLAINISLQCKEKFSNWLSEMDVKIFFYDVTDLLIPLGKAFEGRNVNIATFGRLFAASVLPEKIDKVLYLDCDTLIIDSLCEISNFNMRDYSIAAVYDMSLPPVGAKRELGYKENEIYVNAGVLYINLNYWREYDLEKRFVDYCMNYPDTTYLDQDAINLICHDSLLLLPAKYNMTFITSEIPFKNAIRMLDRNFYLYYDEQEFTISQKSPCIIHFAGELFGKPWYTESKIKYTDYWRQLRLQTPWSEELLHERHYSNNRYIAIYKKIVEKFITIFYRRGKYTIVSWLYSIFYKGAHKMNYIIKSIRRNGRKRIQEV